MLKFAATLLFFFICFNVQAQTWELGGAIGGAGYMGDLNPNNPVKLSGGSVSGFVMRNFSPYLSAKINYAYGQIGAADSNSSNKQFRARNLSFKSKLSEISLLGEFNFMNYLAGVSHNRFTPFIFFGVGLVNYNPQTVYKGQTYDLRPLTTEGEKQYPHSAISIPYGAGFKYNIGGNWNLNFDVGYRQPNTDYLDDVSGSYASPAKLPSNLSRALADRSGENTGVYIGAPGSQRGDGRARDTYMFVQVGFSYTFVSTKCYY